MLSSEFAYARLRSETMDTRQTTERTSFTFIGLLSTAPSGFPLKFSHLLRFHLIHSSTMTEPALCVHRPSPFVCPRSPPFLLHGNPVIETVFCAYHMHNVPAMWAYTPLSLGLGTAQQGQRHSQPKISGRGQVLMCVQTSTVTHHKCQRRPHSKATNSTGALTN